MNTNGFMGLFIRMSEWIFRFTTANILWLVFNIPVIYLLLNIFLVTSFQDLAILGITLLIVVPFIFFPATTAMFGLIRKWSRGEDVAIFKSYLTYYKTNYGYSVLGGFIISIVLVVIIIDYYYLVTYYSFSSSLLLLLVINFIVVYSLHFFSLTVHIDMKFLGILKNALWITLGKPIQSLSLGIVSFLIIFISFEVVTFVIPFFMGSLIAFIAYFCFKSTCDKITSA